MDTTEESETVMMPEESQTSEESRLSDETPTAEKTVEVETSSTTEIKSRTILFALLNGSENVESCLKLADILEDKGFKSVIALDKNSAQNPLIKDCVHHKEVYDCQPLPDWSKQVTPLDLNCLNASPVEGLKSLGVPFVLERFEFVRRCEPFNEELVKSLKPELIIVESMVCSPALTNSGIPWVWLNFSPPNICKNDNRIPPGWSGNPFLNLKCRNCVSKTFMHRNIELQVKSISGIQTGME